MDLGDFDGMEAQHWVAQYPDFLKAWQENPASVTMPGGENLQAVQDRAVEAVERITQLYPSRNVIDMQSQFCKPYSIVLCVRYVSR